IAGTYYRLGNNRKAIEHCTRALNLFEAVGNQDGKAETLNQLARLSESEGYPQKALEYYEEALNIFKKIKNRLGQATVLNNIGGLYKAQADKKALKYYQQALELARAEKDKYRVAAALNNVGSTYQMLGKTELALEHFNQALAIWQALPDLLG